MCTKVFRTHLKANSCVLITSVHRVDDQCKLPVAVVRGTQPRTDGGVLHSLVEFYYMAGLEAGSRCCVEMSAISSQQRLRCTETIVNHLEPWAQVIATHHPRCRRELEGHKRYRMPARRPGATTQSRCVKTTLPHPLSSCTWQRAQRASPKQTGRWNQRALHGET